MISEEDRRTLEELQAELKRVRGELDSKNDELAELKTVADTSKTELAEAKVQKKTRFLRCERSWTQQKRSPTKLGGN